MGNARTRIRRLWLAAALGVGLSGEAAHAALVISIYGGKALTRDSDVTLQQPDGTDLTFQDVSWEDRSFDRPIYYGVRLTYWPSDSARWGVALDSTHAKIHADLDQTVTVVGIRGGNPVRGSEVLGDTFGNLAFSHGHNLITVNALYRWPPWTKTFAGEVRPYIGIGAGVAYPHVEVDLNGVVTDEFQNAGPAYQGLLGLDFKAFKYISLFTEYKLGYADIDADLKGGGSVQLKPWTHQFVLGASYSFR